MHDQITCDIEIYIWNIFVPFSQYEMFFDKIVSECSILLLNTIYKINVQSLQVTNHNLQGRLLCSRITYRIIIPRYIVIIVITIITIIKSYNTYNKI